MPPQLHFYLACLVELGLLVVAVILGWFFQVPALADFHWKFSDLLAGLLSSLPLFALFLWILSSLAKPFVEIRAFMDQVVRPLFHPWPVWQLGVLSLIAGISEEILFRSVIQGGLNHRLGPVPAIVVAGLIFGALHRMTRAYAVIATLMGIYLGVLWRLGGNLLLPITTHAIYDFIALVFYLKITAPPDQAGLSQK